LEQVSSFRKLVDQFDMQEFQHFDGSILTTKAPGILNSRQNEIVFSRHINIHSSVMNDNRKIQKRDLKSRMLQSSLSRMFELSEFERIPGKDQREVFCTKDIIPIEDCAYDDLPMVLLVDDNDFNLITLKEVLHQSFKLRCDLATNGKDCLQKCLIRSANPYRLIFMDCMMPVMDGF
jgi:CheY-like chemotaxis protein